MASPVVDPFHGKAEICDVVAKALRDMDKREAIHLIKALALAEDVDFLPQEMGDFARMAMELYRDQLESDEFRTCMALKASRTWKEVSIHYPTCDSTADGENKSLVTTLDRVFNKIFAAVAESVDVETLRKNIATIMGRFLGQGIIYLSKQLAEQCPAFGPAGAEDFLKFYSNALQESSTTNKPFPTATEMLYRITSRIIEEAREVEETEQ